MTADTAYWSKLDSYYSRTLDHARQRSFDYVVCGAGCYSAAFVHQILRADPSASVLVLEKGTFLFPDHVQNMPSGYLPVMATADTFPWKLTSEFGLHAQIPFVGGRALQWNAWVPQPTAAQLNGWPEQVVSDLRADWYAAARFLGRRDGIEIGGYYGDLHRELRDRLFAGLGGLTTAVACSRAADLESQFASHEDGSLRAWAKFSPVRVLTAALDAYPDRTMLVTNCEVLEVVVEDDLVTGLVTAQGAYDVGGARVILALGVVEAAGLMLRAFPDNDRIGCNLTGHVRSQLQARVPASSMRRSHNGAELAGLYVDGECNGRQLHTHVTGAVIPDPVAQREEVYRAIPEPLALDTFADPAYVGLLLQGLGELPGEQVPKSRNRVTLDNNGELLVTIELDAEDRAFWDALDQACDEIAVVLADGAPLEYLWSDGTWRPDRPPKSQRRDNLLVHEAGVLWMGDDPETSVTDDLGRIHGVGNMHVLGGALYPTCGSWNASFTGVALAFRLVRKLTAQPS